eukprot:3429692-Amphidinium_carterae.1
MAFVAPLVLPTPGLTHSDDAMAFILNTDFISGRTHAWGQRVGRAKYRARPSHPASEWSLEVTRQLPNCFNRFDSYLDGLSLFRSLGLELTIEQRVCNAAHHSCPKLKCMGTKH